VFPGHNRFQELSHDRQNSNVQLVITKQTKAHIRRYVVDVSYY